MKKILLAFFLAAVSTPAFAVHGITLYDLSETHYSQIVATDTLASNYRLVLPSLPGTSGQVLSIASVNGSTMFLNFVNQSGGGGGSGGYAMQPATVTIQAGKGLVTTTETISGLSPGVMQIVAGSSNVTTSPVILATQSQGPYISSVNVANNLTVTANGANNSVISLDVNTANIMTTSSFTANALTQSSATLTYFQINSTMSLSNVFMTISSFSANALTQSSATLTYLNKLSNYVANANTNSSMIGGSAGSSAASLTLGVNPSSGTLQGNTFNGANQLVQMNGSTQLPAVSGVNLTNLNASNLASGTVPNAQLDSSSVTKQGNTFNGASQLIQANASTQYPALDGSLILRVSSLAVTGVTAGSYTNTNLTVNAQGQITSASNGSAGGGGGSTIWGQYNETAVSNTVSTITTNGVIKSSVTASSKYAVFLNFDTTQFTNLASTFTANSSTFTLQGNAFNGASQLVQLNGSSQLPNVSGVNLTALNATQLTSGTVPNARLDSSSATLQGNAFNAANKLLQLDGSGLVPAAQVPTTLSTYIQNPTTMTIAATFGVTASTGVFTSTGAQNTLKLVANGTYGTTDGTSGGFLIDCTGGGGASGECAQFYTNASTQQALSGIVNVIQALGQNTWNEPGMYIKMASTNGGAANIRLDGPVPQIEWVENDQVSPAGKYEDGVNGDVRYLAGRKADNSGFDDFLEFARKDATGGGYIQIVSTQTPLRFHDQGTHFVSFRASDTVAANVAWVLPAADGTSNQAWVTNGAGNLFFLTVATGAAAPLTFTNSIVGVDASSVTLLGPSIALGAETTGNYVANANTNASMTGGSAGSAGATLTLGVDPSSGTLQGNTFNAANKLLQLDASALVPSAQIPTTLSTYVQNPTTMTFADTKGIITSTIAITTVGPGVLHSLATSSQVVSGVVLSTEGGTGLTSYTQGDLIYASAANTLLQLAKDTNSTRYLSNTGASNNPAWAQVNVANGVTGTLQAAQFPALTGDVSNSAGSLNIQVIDDSHNHTVATSTFAVTGGTFTVTGGTTAFNGIAYAWPSAAPGASTFLQAGALANGVYPLTWTNPAGSGDAVKAATQTWSGGNTYNSSSTFLGPVLDRASSAGTLAQVLASSGPGLGVYWTTLAASGGGYAIEPTTVTIKIDKGLAITPNIKTANYTITSTDTIIVASASIVITLPSVTTGASQYILISDIQRSTAPVMIIAPSGLIGNVTNYVQLFAPGQRAGFYSDGTNWNITSMPMQQIGLGDYVEPNSANIVVASTVYCYATTALDFYGVTTIAVDVSAQALQSQFGVYDVAGNVISTTAFTTLGTGRQEIALAKVGFGAPGVAWVCGGSQSATTSWTRKSSGSAQRGACSFATGLPLPVKETFAGCTVPSLTYSFFGYIGGSGIP